MENDVRQRINHYLKENSITKRELAGKLGMQESTLNNKMNGTNKVDVDLVCGVLDLYPDLSAEWLLRGSGGINGQKCTNTKINIDESLEAQNKRLLETIDNLNFMLRILRGEKK